MLPYITRVEALILLSSFLAVAVVLTSICFHLLPAVAVHSVVVMQSSPAVVL